MVANKLLLKMVIKKLVFTTAKNPQTADVLFITGWKSSQILLEDCRLWYGEKVYIITINDTPFLQYNDQVTIVLSKFNTTSNQFL